MDFFPLISQVWGKENSLCLCTWLCLQPHLLIQWGSANPLTLKKWSWQRGPEQLMMRMNSEAGLFVALQETEVKLMEMIEI